MTKTTKPYPVLNRWNSEVKFTAEIDASIEDRGLQLRAVVMWARENKIDLRGSNLCGSNLCGSNLRGSNLRGSNLSGSNLRGSNLSGSNLSDSNLSDSDLRGSNLSGSNLRGSNLRGSDLRGSNLLHAGHPNGYLAYAWLCPETNITLVTVGCHREGWTLARGREYWAGRDDRREVMAALAYIEAVAKSRGWKTE